MFCINKEGRFLIEQASCSALFIQIAFVVAVREIDN